MWRATLRRRRRGIPGTDSAAQTNPTRGAALGRRPDDIGEAVAMSRHTGGAVCVLYFNPMGEGGAAAIDGRVRGPSPAAGAGFCWRHRTEIRVLGRVRRRCRRTGFLRRGLRWRRLPRHRRRRRPHRHAGFVELQAGGCGADMGSVDSDQFFNLADDLWWRSAESRTRLDQRRRRRQTKAGAAAPRQHNASSRAAAWARAPPEHGRRN